MIVQFFRYGNGLSKGALDYLLGKDRQREYAKVLSGSESEVAGLIDSSPFAKKYTSGCLSFYEHDLSDKDKQKIMQDFEQALFPNMDSSQYRVLWIEHQDKLNEETGERRLELNFLIPNIEIHTGQRLQPYYDRADRPRVDLFKKITNHKYQLHDADDPLYRQAVTTAKNLPKTVNEIKETLDIEAMRAVENGLITNRQSMKKWLLDLGLEITRETKKSLSIKNPNDDEKARPIRLTGAIYEQDFRFTGTSEQLTREASRRYRREAEQRNQSDIRKYAEYSAKRSGELERKYRQHEKEHTAETERSNSRTIATNRPDNKPSEATTTARHDNIAARTTAADQTATSELAKVEQLKQRDSSSSKDKENPYYIEFSFDFTRMYNAYQQHLFQLREQEQIQRHQSDGDQSQLFEITGWEHDDNHLRRETVRGVRPESSTGEIHFGQWQSSFRNSEGGTLNDSRSPVIEDYRRSTATIAAATARTAESTGAYTNAVDGYRRIKELHENFKREAQRSSGHDEAVSENYTQAARANYFTSFFEETTRKLGIAASRATEKISDEFESRFRSEKTNSQGVTEFSADRDREADQSLSTTNERETGLSEQLSRKIRGFDTETLFKALDELDRRRELQLEQKRNDRGYDSPSPF